MNQGKRASVSHQILNKARSLGASLAGIASVEQLKKTPSHDIYTKIEPNQGIGSRDFVEGVKPKEVKWPPDAKSALVIALAHKEDDLLMDCWIVYEDERRSRGSIIIEDILNDMSEWVEKEFAFTVHQMPYHLEQGGIFFKDAGVLAGFGCIGKNNLLVTPEYGPRIRVWPMLFDEDLPPTGPVIYDPCDGCDEPCRQACPRNAFGRATHSPIEMGMVALPGKNGWYDRETCRPELDKCIKDKEYIQVEGYKEPLGAIRFCRLCELSCPVGKV